MNLTDEQKATAKPMPMFIRPLRDAIREGRKTMTRRVVTPQPPTSAPIRIHVGTLDIYHNRDVVGFFNEDRSWSAKYAVGDICYLREPLIHLPCTSMGAYSDDGEARTSIIKWGWKSKTLSQMLMPRISARTFCEITGVRVERVQDISEDDAKAEGVTIGEDRSWAHKDAGLPYAPFKISFSALWDSINGKKHPWSSNPWVWVYSFKLL